MSEFEVLFQMFLQEGGFAKPCIREDLERDILDAKFDPNPKPKENPFDKLCEHGNRPLQCSKCYFSS